MPQVNSVAHDDVAALHRAVTKKRVRDATGDGETQLELLRTDEMVPLCPTEFVTAAGAPLLVRFPSLENPSQPNGSTTVRLQDARWAQCVMDASAPIPLLTSLASCQVSDAAWAPATRHLFAFRAPRPDNADSAPNATEQNSDDASESEDDKIPSPFVRTQENFVSSPYFTGFTTAGGSMIVRYKSVAKGFEDRN